MAVWCSRSIIVSHAYCFCLFCVLRFRPGRGQSDLGQLEATARKLMSVSDFLDETDRRLLGLEESSRKAGATLVEHGRSHESAASERRELFSSKADNTAMDALRQGLEELSRIYGEGCAADKRWKGQTESHMDMLEVSEARWGTEGSASTQMAGSLTQLVP